MLNGVYSMAMSLSRFTVVIYGFGVLIAAFIWYLRKRTLGRLLFLAGAFFLAFMHVSWAYIQLAGLQEEMARSNSPLNYLPQLKDVLMFAGFVLVVSLEKDNDPNESK